MKHVMTGIMMSAIAFMVIAAVMVVSGRSVRKNELEKTLEHAAEQAMGSLNKREDQEMSREELIEIFMENMSGGIASDGEVVVSIMKADAEKGILAVRAEEEYHNPLGKAETVRAETTVILEKYSLVENE